MSELRLVNLTKTYPNGFEAIGGGGVSLHIHPGEFIVLVGPSGCGKSTLLRMVAGLESITGGELYINDRLVNRLKPSERDIAMVFQNYALYPHMTNYGNMAFGLKNLKFVKSEIDSRIKQTAEMLEIKRLLPLKPKQLSGGQRQRVAMGRAIVRQPEVFLFDEPLSNLDARLRNQMRAEIRRLQKTLGITTVYVTHDQVEAMTMADRIVVMNHGKVEQVDAPLEIYRNPRSLFVASFIGAPAMNFVHLAARDGVWLAGSQKVASAGSARTRDPLWGFRPEHCLVCEDDPKAYAMRVDLVEQLGADTLVHGTLDGDSSPIIIRLVGIHEISTRQTMHFKIANNAEYFFDEKTGQRIDL